MVYHGSWKLLLDLGTASTWYNSYIQCHLMLQEQKEIDAQRAVVEREREKEEEEKKRFLSLSDREKVSSPLWNPALSVCPIWS